MASGESIFKKQADEVLEKFRKKFASSVSMNPAGVFFTPVDFTADPRLAMLLELKSGSTLGIYCSQLGQPGTSNQIAAISGRKLTFRERNNNALKHTDLVGEKIIIAIMGSRISINQHQFTLPVQTVSKHNYRLKNYCIGRG